MCTSLTLCAHRHGHGALQIRTTRELSTHIRLVRSRWAGGQVCCASYMHLLDDCRATARSCIQDTARSRRPSLAPHHPNDQNTHSHSRFKLGHTSASPTRPSAAAAPAARHAFKRHVPHSLSEATHTSAYAGAHTGAEEGMPCAAQHCPYRGAQLR